MGRMHDKYLIADGKRYILGGRNTYNYFLGDFPGHKNYDRDVLVVCDEPEKENSVNQLSEYFETIWNQEYSGYFHNNKKLANRKFSDFSIMTNSVANNGNPFGAADYAKNRNRILSTGINIWEYEGGYSYHGKSILIDDDLSVIGSFNMDMRSAYLDTELNFWYSICLDGQDICSNKEEGKRVSNIDCRR